MTPLTHSFDTITFNDKYIASHSWTKKEASAVHEDLWQLLGLNHRFNNPLWGEEDLARRRDVPDSNIAANKRAIDGFNQKRNDAIERMDELILSALSAVIPRIGCRLNSETAGSIIDRLSIAPLKIFDMNLQTKRNDASSDHIATCQEKLNCLRGQRRDLANCLDTLLITQQGMRITRFTVNSKCITIQH